MSEARKRPGVAFWASVALVALPILYVTSFGPACWLSARSPSDGRSVKAVYWPLVWPLQVSSTGEPGAITRSISDAVWSYSFLGAPSGSGWRQNDNLDVIGFVGPNWIGEPAIERPGDGDPRAAEVHAPTFPVMPVPEDQPEPGP